MTDREKKIAEIREGLTFIVGEQSAGKWMGRCRFLLSELDRLEREYAEERAELEKENRKLRERLKEEIVWQDECLKLEEQLQSAQQEIEQYKQFEQKYQQFEQQYTGFQKGWKQFQEEQEMLEELKQNLILKRKQKRQGLW